MINTLLLALAVTTAHFSMPTTVTEIPEPAPKLVADNNLFDALILTINPQEDFKEPPPPSLAEVQHMLEQTDLQKGAINKVLTTLRCSREIKVSNNNILTVIDYSLPSSEKRLWVFDLAKQEMLFHTYVSHGITSGALLTNFFSNKYNSKASSIGVYTTEQSYYGREGLSLRLDGLDRGFNDNASGRSVVMHGGWYVDEQFIKRYGRPGRSWGCPALPLDVVEPVIKKIKNKSLFVIYYPNDNWFSSSRFLNCSRFNQKKAKLAAEIKKPEDPHEPILFADLNRNNHKEEQEPVVVISADNYEHVFNTTPPLTRMLRRQINHQEYIALNNNELNQLLSQKDKILNINPQYENIFFVVPEIIMVRGYYETQMKVLPYGKIKNIEANNDNLGNAQTYTVQFDSRVINLRSSDFFIRWLGL